MSLWGKCCKVTFQGLHSKHPALTADYFIGETDENIGNIKGRCKRSFYAYRLLILQMDSQACLHKQQELRLGVLVNPSLEDCFCQGYCLWMWHSDQQILVYGGLARDPAFRNEHHSPLSHTSQMVCWSGVKGETIAVAQDITLRKARLHNHHESGAAVMESTLRSSYPFCLQKSG